MSIKINQSFVGVALPSNDSFRDQILALSGLTHYWVSGEGETAAGGLLSNWVDIKGSAAAISSLTLRPVVAAGAMGDWPGYVFDGVDDAMVASSIVGNVDFVGDFSIATIFKPSLRSDGAYGMVLGCQNGANYSNGFILSTLDTTGKLLWKVGASGGTTTADVIPGVSSLFIGGKSAGSIGGRYNGSIMPRVATDGAMDATAFTFGADVAVGGWRQPMTLAEVLIFSRDITRDRDAYRLLEDYARHPDNYGIGMAYNA